MSINTSATGNIVFSCRCGNVKNGKPDDTLMAEEYLETAGSNIKHDVFIENSPYDPAANIVYKDCLSCGLNFLTLIRVGPWQTVMYTCTCGYRANNDEYTREWEAQHAKKK